jgi:hypothetical protein
VHVDAHLLVGAVAVVEDRVRAVEALTGEALLPEEPPVLPVRGDVVLRGDVALLHAVDQEAISSLTKRFDPALH